MKRFPYWLMPLLWVAGLSVQAAGLSTGSDVTLTAEDYRRFAATDLTPEQRQQILENPLELNDLVLNLHANLGVYQAAETSGLAAREDIQRQLLRARQRILIGAYLRDFEAKLKLPDFEALARQRYDADPKAFFEPEQRRAAHILLAAPKRAGCDCTARPTAEALLERLQKGEDFAALAVEYSDDPGSAARGGELTTWAKAGDETFVAPFAKALFAISEVGQVSPPVETRFGTHLIKLVELKPARQPSFDEVHDRLVAQIRADYAATQVGKMQASYYPAPDQIDVEGIRAALRAADAAQSIAPTPNPAQDTAKGQ